MKDVESQRAQMDRPRRGSAGSASSSESSRSSGAEEESASLSAARRDEDWHHRHHHDGRPCDAGNDASGRHMCTHCEALRSAMTLTLPNPEHTTRVLVFVPRTKKPHKVWVHRVYVNPATTTFSDLKRILVEQARVTWRDDWSFCVAGQHRWETSAALKDAGVGEGSGIWVTRHA